MRVHCRTWSVALMIPYCYKLKLRVEMEKCNNMTKLQNVYRPVTHLVSEAGRFNNNSQCLQSVVRHTCPWSPSIKLWSMVSWPFFLHRCWKKSVMDSYFPTKANSCWVLKHFHSEAGKLVSDTSHFLPAWICNLGVRYLARIDCSLRQ